MKAHELSMFATSCRRIRECLLWSTFIASVLGITFTANDVGAGPLVPPPQLLDVSGGSASIGVTVSLSGSNATAEMVSTLEFLGAALAANPSGFSVVTSSASVEVYLHRFGDPLPPGGLSPGVLEFPAMGVEGYVLEAVVTGSAPRVTVGAADARGLWNGAMTVIQLLRGDAGFGARETSLSAQVIEDYPDHPIRLAMSGASMPLQPEYVSGSCILPDAVKQRIDKLARYKFNRIVSGRYQAPMYTDQWSCYGPRFSELEQYAQSRFVDVVPTLGGIQSAWGLEDRDGWWVRNEPFQFDAASGDALPDREVTSIVQDGGFESEPGVGELARGWRLEVPGSGQLRSGTWTRESGAGYGGGFGMHFQQTGTNQGYYMYQYLGTGFGDEPVPWTPIPEGHYLVSAWVKTATTQAAQLTAYAQSGTTMLTVRSIPLPTSTSTAWQNVSIVLRIPRGQTASRFSVYTRLLQGTGEYWIDDVAIQRIDGDLRNVIANGYPIRVASSDGSQVYTEGSDYTVDAGDLGETYDPALTPTRIVRTSTSSIPLGTTFHVSYDKNLFSRAKTRAGTYSSTSTYGTGSSEQGQNLCSDSLRARYVLGMDRLFGALSASLPALNLGGDEIRGFNRSGACFNPDATPEASNARVLADFISYVLDYATAARPTVEVYLWHDMFSPADNGGVPGYQYDLGLGGGGGYDRGGQPGATFCAIDPEADLCAAEGVSEEIPGAVRFLFWENSPLATFARNATARFLDSHERPFFETATSSASSSRASFEQTIREFAAVGAASAQDQGVFFDSWDAFSLSFPFSWEYVLQEKASLAWNLSHEQIYYEPFEFQLASAPSPRNLFASDFGAASYEVDDAVLSDAACTLGEQFSPGTAAERLNVNGVCINAAGGKIVLPWLPFDNSVAHRLAFDTDQASMAPLSVTFTLKDASGATQTETPITPLLETTNAGVSRAYVVRPKSGGSPPYVSFRAEIGAAGSAKLDNVMIWKERPGCPLGVAVMGAEDEIELSGEAGTGFSVPLLLGNTGCQDLRVTSIVAAPSGNLSIGNPVYPIVVTAGGSVVLTASGVFPGSGVTDHYTVTVASNDDLEPSKEVAVTITGTAGCGLLGLEPLAMLAALRLVVARRNQRLVH